MVVDASDALALVNDFDEPSFHDTVNVTVPSEPAVVVTETLIERVAKWVLVLL